MKNIFKSLVPCFMLVLGMTGCYDTMDDKDVIEKDFAKVDAPTVTLSAPSNVDHKSAALSASVSDVKNVVEEGFMLSTTADFADAKYIIAENMSEAYSCVAADLLENTDYHVKAYAYLGNSSMVCSEVSTFKTKSAPVFTIDGKYTAVETDYETKQPGDPYDVEIKFVAGSTTELEITNLWGGKKTIKASFDPKTNKIEIPVNQVIAVHPKYGDVFIQSAYKDKETVPAKFVPKGGKVVTDFWVAACSAGMFGIQSVEMVRK